MTAIKSTEFTCDLCRDKKVVPGNEVPKGWVIVVRDGRYVDRDFHEQHVCDDCAKQIAIKVGTK